MTPQADRAAIQVLKQELFAAFFGARPPGRLGDKFRSAREILKRAPEGSARRELQAYLNNVVAVFRDGTEAPR
jgi:hypothetical protein